MNPYYFKNEYVYVLFELGPCAFVYIKMKNLNAQTGIVRWFVLKWILWHAIKSPAGGFIVRSTGKQLNIITGHRHAPGLQVNS